MARTKIDLITGILGAGKTTFLRNYVKYLLDKGEKIAILENDFGAVNVDMVMLQDLKSDRCTLGMIAGGCDLDCHRRRFKTQLISLGMQHFDRVVMEPSGIFDMDEFFDTLYETPLDNWFEIGSIVTILDAGMPHSLSEQMEYLLASEAAHSGKLLLSKISGMNETELLQKKTQILEHLNRALKAVSCSRQFSSGDIIAKNWDALTDSDFLEIEQSGYRGASYVKRFTPEDIQSSVHYFMNIEIPRTMLSQVVSSLFADQTCGRIFRIKGSLPDGQGGWLKLNATKEQTEIDSVPEGQAVLIVIGDHISRGEIDRHLQAVNTNPEYVSI